MDPLTINVAPEVTAMVTSISAFQQWVEQRAQFETRLNEYAALLTKQETNLKEQFKDLTEFEVLLKAKETELNAMEVKLKNKEDGMKNITKELSMERAKTKGHDEREEKLKAKIEDLRREKGAANAQVTEIQKKLNESEAIIKDLNIYIREHAAKDDPIGAPKEEAPTPDPKAQAAQDLRNMLSDAGIAVVEMAPAQRN